MNRMIAAVVLALAATSFSAGPVHSAVQALRVSLTTQEQAARLWLLATPETAQKLFPSATTAPGSEIRTGFSAAPTRSAAPSVHVALTPQEQATRLWRLARPGTAQILFPSGEIEPRQSRPYFQRDYRRPYGSALPYDRAVIAERVGEQGRARYAAERGWKMLLGSGGRGIRQGPDSVYLDRKAGVVRVLEAKGGNAWPAFFYGSSQDTNQYAIRSARRVLESPAATQRARVAAAHVIIAAQKGRLVTGVVKTTHVEGKPDEPRLARRWDRTSVKKEARAIERTAVKRISAIRHVFRQARREQALEMLPRRVRQGVGILGLAGAAGLGWQTIDQFRVASAMYDDPALQGTLLPHTQTLFAIGLASQTTALGVSSVAHLLHASTGLTLLADAVFFPVTLGVEGLRLSTALYEYHLGRISQIDLYRRATGTVIAGVMTTGGAIIGGLIGLPAGGIGAVPGGVLGAKIGFLIAMPIQVGADFLWGRYFRTFEADQRQRVHAALYRHYGLTAS